MSEKQNLSDALLSDFIYLVTSNFSVIDEWHKKMETLEKDRQRLDEQQLRTMQHIVEAILRDKEYIKSLANICKNYERTYKNQNLSIRYLSIALIVITSINTLHALLPLVLKLFSS